MFKLNENYYLRKCFFEREQVPTQSVMKKKMSAPLANIYFKSMSPKLKVLAGLELPMKGGGSDWFVPPQDLLEGCAVMKPIKNEFLSKLGFMGIDFFGEKLVLNHNTRMEEEENNVLLDNDLNWKKTIDTTCRQYWEDMSKAAAKRNTEGIRHAFHEFTTLYTTSITKIEALLFNATIKEIQNVREEAYMKMKKRYQSLLKQQSTMSYDLYNERLMKEEARLKAEFIENVEKSRTTMANQIHDAKLEKQVAIEKLRHLLECQNLACQVYVAMKEREECEKEMNLATYEHKKKVKKITEQIAMKDFEIRLAQEKERKRYEFNRIWQKKICHTIKKFQMFVSYCLNTLPEHADFFINMEKLLMLQLNETIENPSAESIFDHEKEEFHTPQPRPHPFYLFCDKGYKPQIDEHLCPKHCTSSASQLPVIVINKRCVYAACDNFEMFTDKIKEFIHGKRGNDSDFDDNHMYEYDVPINYTSSHQLLELKLESSLMQVLQNELPNLNKVQTECCVCKLSHCFCSPMEASKISATSQEDTKDDQPLHHVPSGNKIETRSVELEHEREPKWESYLEYLEPKKCKCSKMAKKHLHEHLPAYMRNMSLYDAPELPNYEVCSLTALKKLVKKAKGIKPTAPPPKRVESKTKDMSTQYSDQEFDYLCNCFSEEEVRHLYQELMSGAKPFEHNIDQFQVLGSPMSKTYLEKGPSSFATERAYSLRKLLDDSPNLQEIFKKNVCNFD